MSRCDALKRMKISYEEMLSAKIPSILSSYSFFAPFVSSWLIS
jgi:hypothetical protein